MAKPSIWTRLVFLVVLSAPSLLSVSAKDGSCGRRRRRLISKQRQRRTEEEEDLGPLQDRDHSDGSEEIFVGPAAFDDDGNNDIIDNTIIGIDRGKSDSSDSNDFNVEAIDDDNIEIAVNLWLTDLAAAIDRFGFIQFWDVDSVQSMRNLFKDAATFNDNIGDWDVSCVTDFQGMFWGATAFNQDLSNWQVQSGTGMFSMFRNAISYNQNMPWPAESLLDMSFMFSGADKFQGDLSSFDTSNVFSMESTFEAMNYNGDISQWNVDNLVISASMFENNLAFNSKIKKWHTPSLQIFERMFFNATSFSQNLCWDINPYQQSPSWSVFCASEGSFNKSCVPKQVIEDAEQRCGLGAIQGYLQSFIDFFESITGFFEDIGEFFGNITGSIEETFELIGNITCFAPEATALVEDVGSVAMKDLRVGDKVMTSSGEYQPVYSMFHSSKTKETPYLQIHTSHSQNTTTGVRPLELTANHMLHVEGYDNAIPAWQVQVGDFVYAMDISNSDKPRYRYSKSRSLTTRQHLGLVRVMEIHDVIRNGLYHPLTADGTIIVDGISTSTYASFLGTEHIHLFRRNSTDSVATLTTSEIDSQDGWKVMSHQTFVHLLLAPYRTMCLHYSMDLCKVSNDDSDDAAEDLEWYGRFGQVLLKMWLQQHVLLQAVIFVALVALFGLCSILLSPLGLSLALAAGSSSIIYRQSSTIAEQSGLARVEETKKTSNTMS